MTQDITLSNAKLVLKAEITSARCMLRRLRDELRVSTSRQVRSRGAQVA